MIDLMLFSLTDRLPTRLIPRCPGEPYLERYYLGQLFGFTFYLHRFVSCDAEPFVHNHPWRTGFACVLTGSYLEEVALDVCPSAGESGCVTKVRRVRWFNRVDGGHFHRIVSTAPGTWTLFAHGPRAKLPCGKLKGWGFFKRMMGVAVFEVFPPSTDLEWRHTAPIGSCSGREPWLPH